MRILTRPNVGGPTAQAIALWHAHAAMGVDTLLVTGRCGPDEAVRSPAAAGVPQVDLAAVLAAPASARGWLELASLARGLHPWRDWCTLRALRRIAETWRPDVVHTHTSKAGALGRMALGGRGIRLVHTFHGLVLADYFGPLASRALCLWERRLAARTDVLVAVSDSCAQELAALGIAPRARIAVVPPAVALAAPCPRARARARLDLPAGGTWVATVGRLVPIKRTAHFLTMLAALPDVGGCVFGDGPQRAALARQAAPLGTRCRFLGSRLDAGELLPAFDAVVLAGRREGLPLAAVEAFGAGVPVVGYHVPGVVDALRTLGAGILVPPAEGPMGLARAVAALRADPARAADLVAKARTALPCFAPAAVGAQLLELYRGSASP